MCFRQPQVLHLAATLVAFARIRVALMMIPGTLNGSRGGGCGVLEFLSSSALGTAQTKAPCLVLVLVLLGWDAIPDGIVSA